MADILVIKVNTFMSNQDYRKLYDNILYQKEKGLILLPPYLDAQLIPEGVEIITEDPTGHKKGINND